MKKVILTIGILGFLYGCGPAEKRDSDRTNPINEMSDNLLDRVTPDWTEYEGKFPCVDCEAIHVRLRLEKADTETTPDYQMVLEYKNTSVGDTREEVEGNYTIIAGHGEDRNATLIQLNPGTAEPRYFVENEDQSITMLGESMQPLDEADELNYRLEIIETE
jgi:hypothetical protein